MPNFFANNQGIYALQSDQTEHDLQMLEIKKLKSQSELPHEHPLKALEAFFTSGGVRTDAETVTIRTDRFFAELDKAVDAIEQIKDDAQMQIAEMSERFDF